jgi:hypothetical protein
MGARYGPKDWRDDRDNREESAPSSNHPFRSSKISRLHKKEDGDAVTFWIDATAEEVKASYTTQQSECQNAWRAGWLQRP